MSLRALFFLSVPLKAANVTSTVIVARSVFILLRMEGSAGPVTVQMTLVLPCST